LADLQVHDPVFSSIVAADASLTRLLDGFGFTEGPIWHPTEHWLLFSDIQESRQYRWSERDGLSLFRAPSNQANGNCFDLLGRVVSCEHASSQVVRHEHDGKLVRAIAAHHDGRALNSPNDVVCDRRGRIVFTDPSFGRIREDLGILREPELAYRGLFRIDPDGALHLLASDFDQPNGLCFSADERILLVNDSWASVIREFHVADDGSLSGGKVWAPVKGEGEGVPDGMKIDAFGHVFCNGPGGVHVFGPDAKLLGVIRTPEKSTNFCFGGADLATLFITASTSIYRIETRSRGLPMLHGNVR